VNQLAMEFYAPRTVRKADPVTSQQAAFKAREFSTSHAARILDALRRFGPMSAHEIADRTGLSVVQVDRRRHEMIAVGTVRLYKVDGRIVERGGAQVWECVS
jgi:predicted transcriptional regulator